MANEKCTLTDEELIRKCRSWISRLCATEGKAWVLEMPANTNKDPDMLLGELIERYARQNR